MLGNDKTTPTTIIPTVVITAMAIVERFIHAQNYSDGEIYKMSVSQVYDKREHDK